MLYHKVGPVEAFAPFRQAGLTFVPYCDAGGLVSLFNLTVLDCLNGLAKAVRLGWVNFDAFDAADYEFHEQVENGDWNWVVPNKFLAFAGPQGFDNAPTDLAPCTPPVRGPRLRQEGRRRADEPSGAWPSRRLVAQRSTYPIFSGWASRPSCASTMRATRPTIFGKPVRGMVGAHARVDTQRALTLANRAARIGRTSVSRL